MSVVSLDETVSVDYTIDSKGGPPATLQFHAWSPLSVEPPEYCALHHATFTKKDCEKCESDWGELADDVFIRIAMIYDRYANTTQMHANRAVILHLMRALDEQLGLDNMFLKEKVGT